MNALARFRKAKGLTQSQVSELLGTTKATVSRWETDKRRPDPAMAIAIERKLGIPRQHLRPDLFGTSPASVKAARTGKKSIFGCMKGMITFAPGVDPSAPPYSQAEWQDMEKQWADNWDRMMQQ
jgi:transcriptional regulator with XRE-family HTH domain